MLLVNVSDIDLLTFYCLVVYIFFNKKNETHFFLPKTENIALFIAQIAFWVIYFLFTNMSQQNSV